MNIGIFNFIQLFSIYNPVNALDAIIPMDGLTILQWHEDLTTYSKSNHTQFPETYDSSIVLATIQWYADQGRLSEDYS